MPWPAADFYAQRRVLITGGTGFLGRNLVAALKEVGAKVRTLSRSSPPDPSEVAELFSGVRHFRGDLRERDVVDAAVEGAQVVFNLAGHSGSISSNTEPFEDLDVNLRGQITLLEACRQLDPRPTVVFSSSRLVYRPSPQLPVPETALTGPLSLYGVHKLAAEHYHFLYAHLHRLKAVVLRITNPYGTTWSSSLLVGEGGRYSIINWFIHLAVTDQVLPIYGDGHQLRDYVHVDDVTRAFLIAGANPKGAGMIFNVGSGQGVSFKTMAETVVEEAGAGRIEHRPWPAEAAMVETGDFVADVSRIAGVLGWQPTTQLAAGLRRVIGQYRQMQTVP